MKISDLLFLLTIIYIFHIIKPLSSKYFLKQDQTINLSNYKYPKPNSSSDIITVAILNTNDIHGAAFKQEIKLGKETYSKAGIENLGGYINALQKEFKQNFLWLDSGDQFSGTLESKLTDGKIMTDFFNLMGLNAATLGNHEFDWGKKTMNQRMKQADFPYIVNNIIRKDGKKLDIKNVVKYKIFDAGNGVKIGVTGITTKYTPKTTAGDTSHYKFLDYKPQIIKYAQKLRNKGANMVILLAHAGIECKSKNSTVDNYLHIRLTTNKDDIGECYGNEIFDLINDLPEDTVDAVFSGHVHRQSHSFVKNIPVLQNNFHAINVNVGYFNFDKKTKKYIKNNTVIEGPIPVCSKIFSKSLNCDVFGNNHTYEDIAKIHGELTNFSFHGLKIGKIQKVEDKLQSYRVLVNKSKHQIITNIEVKMQRDNNKNSPLANFICDIAKSITKSDFCILNQGIFRGNWYPGPISYYKFYEMLSLSNNLVNVKVTGKQLKKIMKILDCGEKSFYATSGLTSYVVNKPKKCLVNVKKSNGKEIKDHKIYTFASADFLINGGDDFSKVLKLFKVDIYKNFGELREVSIDWLKKHPVITREMVEHSKHPSLIFVDK